MRVSLVIPVQDEEDTIGVLLDSIAAQSRLPDEVVVVDAGSEDRTRERVDRKGLPPETGLRVVAGGRLFPGVARNLGAAEARNDWLAFTDAGIELDSAWLQTLEEGVGEPPADVVFGSYEPVCDTFFRRAAAVAYVPPPGPQGIRGPSVTSILLRRSAFEAVGGFAPYRASEDLLFMSSLLESALKIRYAPGAVARWSIPGDLTGTIRRFRLYSFHNLVAGKGGAWHLGLGKLYAVAAGLAVLGLSFGGGLATATLIPGFYLARALKAALSSRRSLPFPTTRAACIFGATGIVAAVDLATAMGALDWIVRGCPRRVE